MFSRIRVCLLFLSISFSVDAFELSRQEIDTLREDPIYISSLFAQKKSDIIKEFTILCFSVSEPELFVIFCCMVAHQVAPYGNSSQTDLKMMLHENTLNCGNYGLLALKLAETGIPNIRNLVKVHFIGWEGGSWGNHQTLFIASNNSGVFIDPTTGVLAIASFDQIASGKMIDRNGIFHFSVWDIIVPSRDLVTNILIQGLSKPSDLLYYYANYDGFLQTCTDANGLLTNPSDTSLWMTPAGQKRCFPY